MEKECTHPTPQKENTHPTYIVSVLCPSQPLKDDRPKIHINHEFVLCTVLSQSRHLESANYIMRMLFIFKCMRLCCIFSCDMILSPTSSVSIYIVEGLSRIPLISFLVLICYELHDLSSWSMTLKSGYHMLCLSILFPLYDHLDGFPFFAATDIDAMSVFV